MYVSKFAVELKMNSFQVIEDEKGHYMYMYVFGGNDDVTQGNLIILADGSKDLFRYSSPCLNIWCKNVKFLGNSYF